MIPAMITGYRLVRSGWPYGVAMLTGHKLISLAVLVLLDRAVWKMHRTAPLDTGVIAAAIAMNVLFVGTIATGGWIAASEEVSVAVHTAHRIGPWLSAVSAGAMLFLLGR